MTSPTEVTPIRFHAPGWELGIYLVWGPGPITHQGMSSGQIRDHWAASVTGGGKGTAYRAGASLDEVLPIFPPRVRKLFREALPV